jgi:hypothetical protein
MAARLSKREGSWLTGGVALR